MKLYTSLQNIQKWWSLTKNFFQIKKGKKKKSYNRFSVGKFGNQSFPKGIVCNSNTGQYTHIGGP